VLKQGGSSIFEIALWLALYKEIYTRETSLLLLLVRSGLDQRALVKHRNQGILVENSPYLIYKKILLIFQIY